MSANNNNHSHHRPINSNQDNNNDHDDRMMYNSDDDEVDYDALEKMIGINNEQNASTVHEEDDYGDAGEPASTLMKLIQLYDWAGTLARISSHPHECRTLGMHRRTPLHVACNQDAPAVVIQALLKAYPDASLCVGTTNMNPLHITCSSQRASVHVVRVLLENGRFEQFSMKDMDGDTPLHAACRCGAPIDVLEVLLLAHYAAVHERDYEGLTPVQRLWVRYFVILGDDVIESVNCAADLSGELLDAWNKTELLLRCGHYGHLDITSRRNGLVRFRAVHAAAAVDCPRAIVKIATKVYPHQMEEPDEHGRTPLMIAAAAPIYKVRDLSDDGYALEDVIYSENNNNNIPDNNNYDVESSENDGGNCVSYPSVIEILLQANFNSPCHGASIPDPSGRLPLHVALATGKRWNEGVKQLIEAYPDAVSIPDGSSKLYPFMLCAVSNNTDLSATYEILRLNPTLLLDDKKPFVKVQQRQQQSSSLSSPPTKEQEHVRHIETPDKLLEATKL